MQPLETGLAEQLLQHQAFLQRLARGLAGSDAEDLVQDVWRRALEHPPIHSLRLRAWIAQITRNLAANRRRDELRRRGRETDVARWERSEDGPHSRAARFELHRELVGLLAALDEPYRDTLLMRYFEGLLPEEIARRSGLPTATVPPSRRMASNSVNKSSLGTLRHHRPGKRSFARSSVVRRILPLRLTMQASTPARSVAGSSIEAAIQLRARNAQYSGQARILVHTTGQMRKAGSKRLDSMRQATISSPVRMGSSVAILARSICFTMEFGIAVTSC